MATINGTEGDDKDAAAIHDLAGNDTINLLAGDDWVFMAPGGTDAVRGGAGTDVVIYGLDYARALRIDLKAGFSIDGRGNRDTLIGFEAAHGTRFGDAITLGDANGYVFARAGDDVIRAGSGGSYVVAGSGSDTVIGGSGFDTVSFYDNSRDYGDVDGGGAITHGAVVDLAEASATDGWGGRDTLRNIEKVEGTQFADTIAGDGRANELRGGGGSDAIRGRGGDDTLWGDEPGTRGRNDTLSGGAGRDMMTGGGGKDVFVFDAKLSEKTNVDTIADFNGRDDTIALDRAVFAVGMAGRLDADLFAGAKGDIDGDTRIIYDRGSGNLAYDADGSGRKHDAVLFAVIDNHAKLTASDFVVV